VYSGGSGFSFPVIATAVRAAVSSCVWPLDFSIDCCVIVPSRSMVNLIMTLPATSAC
jgi:hypothetical protein